MKTIYKNKLIFKGLFENILPFKRIWYLKEFNMKYLFDEDVEMNLYRTCRVMIKEITKKNLEGSEDFYNLIRLKIEDMYEDKVLDEIIDYVEDIESITLDISQMEVYKNHIYHYIKEVATFYKLKDFAEIFDEIRDATDYSAANKQYEQLFSELEKAIRLNPEMGNEIGINVSGLTQDIIDSAMETGRTIPFPKAFDCLNTATMGGATTKTLNVIEGFTNVGKSRKMINMMVEYFFSGENVAYITMELSREEILIRVLSIVLKKPTHYLKKLYKDNPKKILEMFKNNPRVRKRKNNMIIQEFSAGVFAPRDYEEYITTLKILPKESRPDIIFLDGINNMTTDEYKGSNSYFAVEEIAHKVHGINKKYDIMGWTTNQLNKDTYNRLGNDITKTQKGFSLIQAADFVLILEENRVLAERGIQAITEGKNRYSRRFNKPMFVKILDQDLFNMEEIPMESEEYDELKTIYEEATGNNAVDW